MDAVFVLPAVFQAGINTVAQVEGKIKIIPLAIVAAEVDTVAADGGQLVAVTGHKDHLAPILVVLRLKVNSRMTTIV